MPDLELKIAAGLQLFLTKIGHFQRHAKYNQSFTGRLEGIMWQLGQFSKIRSHTHTFVTFCEACMFRCKISSLFIYFIINKSSLIIHTLFLIVPE